MNSIKTSALLSVITVFLACGSITTAQRVGTTSTAAVATPTTTSIASSPTANIATSSTTAINDSPTTDAIPQAVTRLTSAQTSTTAQAETTSVTLPEGVIYQLLRAGTGPQATTTGTRLIHYTLYLTDGTKLESSRDNELPVPFEFAPGTNEAIRGMELGTDNMRVGEIRKVYVPADLAYGEQPHGNVPANSPLVFKIELVDLTTSTASAPPTLQ